MQGDFPALLHNPSITLHTSTGAALLLMGFRLSRIQCVTGHQRSLEDSMRGSGSVGVRKKRKMPLTFPFLLALLGCLEILQIPRRAIHQCKGNNVTSACVQFRAQLTSVWTRKRLPPGLVLLKPVILNTGRKVGAVQPAYSVSICALWSWI